MAMTRRGDQRAINSSDLRGRRPATTTLKGDPATKHIPIMLVTALADFNAKERGRTAGAEAFLSKPIDRDTLVLQVRRLLRETYADYRDT